MFILALKDLLKENYGNILLKLSVISCIFFGVGINKHNELTIAISSGAVISLVVLIIQELGLRYKLRTDFMPLNDSYKCYSYINNDDHHHTDFYLLDKKGNGSTAEVNYMGDSTLEIIVTEKNGNIWEGTISMHTPLIGQIAWQYTKGSHEIGIKDMRVFNNKKTNKLEIHLFAPPHDKKYGREVLVQEDTIG